MDINEAREKVDQLSSQLDAISRKISEVEVEYKMAVALDDEKKKIELSAQKTAMEKVKKDAEIELDGARGVILKAKRDAEQLKADERARHKAEARKLYIQSQIAIGVGGLFSS
jgi:hypothetical protein